MAKKNKHTKPPVFLPCVEKYLPEDKLVEAASKAVNIFPANAPGKISVLDDPQKIAVQTSKFWGDRVKTLTVGFMERPSQAMIDKVLAYANSWSEFSKAKFTYTASLSNAIIRISFGRGGYYSYLGTDCLSIPRNRNTMNLESFTVNTAESEWHRVVKHEFGHALGCPHEQQRRDVLALLDERKVIEYFKRTQGWSEQEVRQQILVPLEERSLMQGSSPQGDVQSIMCYSFPGSVTKNGEPIPGGMDFSPVDKEYFGKIYPKDTIEPPPPPPPPPPGKRRVLLEVDGEITGARVVSVT